MLGTGMHFSRNTNRDDRFCSVSRTRRSRDFSLKRRSDESSRRKIQHDDQKSEPAAAPLSEPTLLCNLERFLQSVTPSVPAQYLSKLTVKDWRTCNVEYQPFFELADLWESFKEWSVYGAGVPLVLDDCVCVDQYYVPYLSGIQLYADLSKSTANSRGRGEESDWEYFRDSSSDQSSDSEQDRGGGLKSAREQLNQFHRSDRFHRVNLSAEQHTAYQESLSSDDGEFGNSQGSLLLEYFARDQPYAREPLADKIYDLSRRFPELNTLRSCDLLSASWMSVAWYPIYRIPTGPTLKDLDACFLTFHSLHTPTPGGETTHHPPNVTYPSDSDGDGFPQISLPIFGLASYKYKPSLWTLNDGHQHLSNFLGQAADNWLKSLNVEHPDYSFFRHR